MTKRIDLFMPPKSCYQALHYFTIQFGEALRRGGVNVRVLEAQRDNPRGFLDTLLSDPPDCTLSFNGLLPDQQGQFFCDLIKIPHIACVIDPPTHFLALTHSPYSVITAVDRHFVDFYQSTGFKNALFMPHGVDPVLGSQPLVRDDNLRPYDVVLLASFIDCDQIEAYWKEHFPSSLCSALQEAALMVLSDADTSYIQAFSVTLDKQSQNFDPHKVDILKALDQLQDYINGKDRIALLQALKSVNVHVFGTGSHKWQKYLGNNPTMTFHEAIPFEQAIEVMKKSKIILNSCPIIKQGTHERILTGLACGAAVITDENAYMRENFTQLQNILFYRPQHWNEARELVHSYLENEKKRYDLVEEGRKLIQDSHTWDHRAATLISEVDPILNKMSI